MDAELRLAFWNLSNYFEPNTQNDRAPNDFIEYARKREALAQTITSFFSQKGPHLLALAEVGSDDALEQLRCDLPRSFTLAEWCPASKPGDTGLALLGNEEIIAEINLERPYPESGRPWIAILRCYLVSSREPFFVVVNHWASKLKRENAARRREAAMWLLEQLKDLAVTDSCVIVVGDFNCDPFETPLHRDLMSSRLRSWLWCPKRRIGNRMLLYNTAWRLIGEPDCWEYARQSSAYREPRPTSTTDYGRAPTFYDQLLVSSRALCNGPLALREESVSYYCDDRTAKHSDFGVLFPVRWKYQSPTEYVGASDHFPLLCVFDINSRKGRKNE